MSVWVYKKGDSCEVNGVKCDKALVDVSSLQSHLSAGWVVDAAELAEKPKKRGRKPKVETDEQTSETL